MWHEIVKYNPIHYDKNGIYTIDEWTSRSDVGKCYNGKAFSIEDYLAVEQQYIDAALSIMDAAKCAYMTIHYIEADKKYIADRIKSSKFYDIDLPLLQSLPLLSKGKKIHYTKIGNVCRLALREYIYVVLRNDKHKLQIEFGYDYYMKVSSSLSNTILQEKVNKIGLFLDPR